jgi:hypothetical protein
MVIVCGPYRQIYTTNISPKRRKIYIYTHIYICKWHVSMYTSRIITIAETRAENNETESERCFLEGIEWQGGATGQLRAKPGRAHHATALQELRRGGHVKTGLRGAGPAVPPWHRLSLPRSCRQHWWREGRCGGVLRNIPSATTCLHPI